MSDKTSKNNKERRYEIIQISLDPDDEEEKAILSWFDAKVAQRRGRGRSRSSVGREILAEVMKQEKAAREER